MMKLSAMMDIGLDEDDDEENEENDGGNIVNEANKN